MPRITQNTEEQVRFSVAQAARDLGISAVVLSKQLRRKRIEPADGRTYSLRQLVDSQQPWVPEEFTGLHLPIHDLVLAVSACLDLLENALVEDAESDRAKKEQRRSVDRLRALMRKCMGPYDGKLLEL